MTHKGGWQNYHQTKYELPRSKPLADEDVQMFDSDEGRFRCIRRKNGRIESVIWEYETEDAEAWYAKERREDSQRDQLRTMDVDELRVELRERNLNRLSTDEVLKAYADEIEFDDSSESSEETDELPPLVHEFVRDVADRSGPSEALAEYRELKEAIKK